MLVPSKLFMVDNCVCDQDGSSEHSRANWEREKVVFLASIKCDTVECTLVSLDIVLINMCLVVFDHLQKSYDEMTDHNYILYRK